MEILEKLKNLKENIEKVQKLNEDLIETHLASKNKIKSHENKINASSYSCAYYRQLL